MATLVSWLFPSRAEDGVVAASRAPVGDISAGTAFKALPDSMDVRRAKEPCKDAEGSSSAVDRECRFKLSARGPYFSAEITPPTADTMMNDCLDHCRRTVHFCLTAGPQPTRLPGCRKGMVPRCGEGKWAVSEPAGDDELGLCEPEDDESGPSDDGDDDDDDDEGACWPLPEAPKRLQRWPRPPPLPATATRLRAPLKPRQPRVLSMGPITSPPRSPQTSPSAVRGAPGGRCYTNKCNLILRLSSPPRSPQSSPSAVRAGATDGQCDTNKCKDLILLHSSPPRSPQSSPSAVRAGTTGGSRCDTNKCNLILQHMCDSCPVAY